MMTDWVRSKPWLGLLGNLSAAMATLCAFGVCMYAGVDFIGINLAAPFLMIGKSLNKNRLCFNSHTTKLFRNRYRRHLCNVGRMEENIDKATCSGTNGPDVERSCRIHHYNISDRFLQFLDRYFQPVPICNYLLHILRSCHLSALYLASDFLRRLRCYFRLLRGEKSSFRVLL